ITKQSLMWAAGQLADSDFIKELVAFAPVSPRNVQFLSKIKAFGLNLLSENDLVLLGYFQTGDAASTRWLQKQLEELEIPKIKSKVVSADADITEGSARWVTLQMRGEPGAMRAAMGQ